MALFYLQGIKIIMSNLSTSNTDFNAAKGSGEEIQVQEQVTNVFFSEEREVSSSKVYASEPTFSPNYSDSILMPEQKWLLSEILTRPIQLPTIAWSTSDAFRTQIAAIDVPRSIYSLNVVPISVLLSMMSFLRSDWTIRLQLNSPKFSQGRLLVYLDPLYVRPVGTGAASLNKVSIFNAMIMPHAWLDPSESKVVELVLPFRHVLDYFNLNNGGSIHRIVHANSLGVLRFIVFNPLQVSTGTSSSVYLTPSIYAQSPNVHVPNRSHTLETPLLSRSDDFVPVVECGLSDAIGAISDVVTAGAAITSGSPGMVTSTLKAVSSVSKVLQNLDRPLAYGEIMLPCNRMVAPFAHGSGVDSSIRLSLIENSQTETSESNAGAASKEMDLSTILKIPTVISIVTWDASTGADTALAIFPVTPVYMFREHPGLTTNFLSYSNLGAWGARFAYWRGGIRFRFSFVCTQFHAGRLRVSFFPNEWTPSAVPNAAAGSSVPSMIMDLQTKKEFEFVVPFYSACPYLGTAYPYEGLVNVGATNAHFNSQDQTDRISGMLVIYVLNPLIVNSNAPGSIPINVFMSAADDFEFSYPTEFQPEIVNPAVAVSECGLVEAPGDIIEGEDLLVKPTSNVLSHGSGIVSSPFLFSAGESHMNVKNLIRRFGIINTFTLASPAAQFPNVEIIKIPVRPNNYFSIASATDNRIQDLFSYFSSFYLSWKGSIRYKLVSTVSKNAQLLVYVYQNVLDRSANISSSVVPFRYGAFAYGSAAMNFSSSPSIEIEVPYASNYSQMLVDNDSVSTNWTSFYTVTSNLKFMFVTTADAVFPVAAGAYIGVHAAAGDDFVLSFYLGPVIFAAPAADYPQ